MAEGGFNTENITEVVEDWTIRAVEDRATAQEKLLTGRLIPELKMEMAVMEMQKKEIAKIRAAHEIKNLVSKFVLSIKGGFFEDAYGCFALETPGIFANIEKYGIYEGKEKLHEYFVDYYRRIGGKKGCFIMHELTDPVLVISDNGQSARAMFSVQGILAVDMNNYLQTHEVARSIWQFSPWYLELIKETETWKIFSLTIYDEIETTYESGWSEPGLTEELYDPAAPEASIPAGTTHRFSPERKPYLHHEPPFIPGCGHNTVTAQTAH